jgi:hypothetical protein
MNTDSLFGDTLTEVINGGGGHFTEASHQRGRTAPEGHQLPAGRWGQKVPGGAPPPLMAGADHRWNSAGDHQEPMGRRPGAGVWGRLQSAAGGMEYYDPRG